MRQTKTGATRVGTKTDWLHRGHERKHRGHGVGGCVPRGLCAICHGLLTSRDPLESWRNRWFPFLGNAFWLSLKSGGWVERSCRRALRSCRQLLASGGWVLRSCRRVERSSRQVLRSGRQPLASGKKVQRSANFLQIGSKKGEIRPLECDLDTWTLAFHRKSPGRDALIVNGGQSLVHDFKAWTSSGCARSLRLLLTPSSHKSPPPACLLGPTLFR